MIASGWTHLADQNRNRTDEYMQETWGSSGDIEATLTARDRTRKDARSAYDAKLAGMPVIDTIAEAVERLRSLPDC